MKIAIYTDDAPIAEDKLASGMNRVNTRLFTAINDNVSVIITSFQHRDFDFNDLDPILSKKTRFLSINKLLMEFIRKTNKLLSKIFPINIDILFNISKRNIVNILNNSNSDILFVPLGSNIRAYSRAIELSKETNLPLAVYIVDEFLDAAILSEDKYGKQTCEKYLQEYLEHTKTIFVISPGMKKYLKTSYGVESIVLNLPFEKKYNVEEDTIMQILFLGNISHFYLDGLVELLDLVTEYNNKNEMKLILRLTSNFLPTRLQKYESIIKYEKINGDENLAKEINRSLFCYIPYSFDKKYKIMVSTSFPSKTLECLSYAKRIVVYGPSYCSVVKYFEDNKINDKTTYLNYTYLRDKVINQYDFSTIYKKNLEKNHNFRSIQKKLLGALYE